MQVDLTTIRGAGDDASYLVNTWPMYVHEIAGFDTDFYTLDDVGRWQPDIVGDWIAPVTPAENLREPRPATDGGKPFQRSHVIVCEGKRVGFVCVGAKPFKYMPDDADFILAE